MFVEMFVMHCYLNIYICYKNGMIVV